MSLFCFPVGHAENAPETWEVRKAYPTGRTWALVAPADRAYLGHFLGTFPRKMDATMALTCEDSFWRKLYREEAAWYAGEPIPGWRPYEPRPCKTHPTPQEENHHA